MSLRLLVVEDDPTARAFIVAALADFFIIDAVRTLAEAGDACAEHDYTLMLLDLALPDGEGDGWLARQRALGNRCPALALTAELDTQRERRLLACGFVAALAKPIGAAALRQAVAPWAKPDDGWNDEAGLSALGGSSDLLSRMRGLFLDELPGQRDAIRGAAAAGHVAALRSELHRLRAGCGFVGATELGEAVDALHREPASAALAGVVLARIDAALAGRYGSRDG